MAIETLQVFSQGCYIHITKWFFVGHNWVTESREYYTEADPMEGFDLDQLVHLQMMVIIRSFLYFLYSYRKL